MAGEEGTTHEWDQIDRYYEEDEEAEYTESNPKWKLIIPKHFMDPENLTSDLGSL